MPTPKDIFAKMQDKIIAKSDEFSKIDSVYKFVLNGPDGGTWIVDLRKTTFGLRESDEVADCTIMISADDFVNIAIGRLGAESAFMRGKLKLFGNMGLAMKLGKLFQE